MPETASAAHPSELVAAATEWLSHRAFHAAVPLSAAVAELRYRCPGVAVSDRDLELLVADMALARGLALSFEGRQDVA